MFPYIYVSGYTNGSLDGNANIGGNDIILLKYDLTGVKQWTSQFGTVSNYLGLGVNTDGSEKIYLTGSVNGRLDGNIHVGSADLFLAKLNESGFR